MEVLADRFGVSWREPATVEHEYLTAAGVVRWPLTVSHSSGPIAFELLAGGSGTVWATDAVTTLHHYAFWTTDLPGEVAALQHKRWELELTVAGDDHRRPHGFAYLVRPGSARLELISRSPR
jgi:Glyoxalase/Bleomycin resistance protein/Dioxygenase superfamily